MSREPKPTRTHLLGEAEAAVAQCLAVHDFAGAVRAVASYEILQPTDRGIGVDRSNSEIESSVGALRSIYESSVAASREVRQAAAMMFLFGVSKPFRRWLAREANGDSIATSLLISAYRVLQAELTQRSSYNGFI
jgi:hypothetical protein